MIIKTAQKLSRKLFEMLRNQYEKGTKKKKQTNKTIILFPQPLFTVFLCVCMCGHFNLKPRLHRPVMEK